MISEIDIMMCIYADITINIEQIKMSRDRISKINSSINLLNNNYFELKITNNSLFKQYLNMYNDYDLYYESISKLENLKTQIENYIKNKCEHEWVNDTIDIDPDRSQNICYCLKCELTKK